MQAGLPLYRSDDVRAIERHAAAHGLDGDTLMQRAAQAALACIPLRWPQARRLLVLCGTGNNGGDGFVLARLAREAGYAVRVLQPLPRESRAPEAQRARAALLDSGGTIEAFDPEAGPGAFDLAVDALFGIGLRDAPQGTAAALIQAVNATAQPVLALDLPSGVDADTGAVPGAAIRAAHTLTFIVAKRGLASGASLDHVGTLSVDALGLSPAADWPRPVARRLAPVDVAGWLLPRPRTAHKGLFGHVLVVGGDHGYGGAARLCAEAALRGGAGLVSVATRPRHVAAILAARPECMALGVPSPERLAPLLARASVVALGPGLGQGAWGAALHDAVLAAGLPTVLDADALNRLATHPAPLPPGCVMTPHPGEAARLLGIPTATLQRDRFAAVEALVQRFQCVVLLKGAGTLVAAPGRVTSVIEGGNPGMASGGMGDVLTGLIAALRAQGLEPYEAACAGAVLHAAAGDRAAADGHGLLASDLFPALRRVLDA